MHRTMPHKHQPTKAIILVKLHRSEDDLLEKKSSVFIEARQYMASGARTLASSAQLHQARCARESQLKPYKAPLGRVYRATKKTWPIPFRLAMLMQILSAVAGHPKQQLFRCSTRWIVADGQLKTTITSQRAFKRKPWTIKTSWTICQKIALTSLRWTARSLESKKAS